VDPDQVPEMSHAEVRLAEPAGRELAQDDLEDRPVADRPRRLGEDRGEGPEPHPEPGGEHDGPLDAP
jgi:hypothetical protein